MPNPLKEVEAQIHFWPWSVDISEESKNLTDKNVEFPFYGSPIATISKKAQLLVPSRMERFKPLGCPYDSVYQIYETPHGVLAGQISAKKLKIRVANQTFEVSFNAIGAVSRYETARKNIKTPLDSTIARYILDWSQVFDDLFDKADERTSEIMWSEVINFLDHLEIELTKPKMAIIVRIAQDMRKQLPEIVFAARRILLRELELVPIHRIQESDARCLRWYVRQPGEKAAEKAGNKQRLLAVVRRSSFDTLENQILKDFIYRCHNEATRYLQTETLRRLSSRAILVQGYKQICNVYSSNAVFEHVKMPSHGVQPNYVLQNDTRYRRVWFWYRKLLKREHEEDSLWDWQARTWADIMRLFIGASFELICKQSKKKSEIRTGFVFEPLVDAPFRLTLEQDRGCRLVPGTLPGPILITRMLNSQPKERIILELVHPDLASQHPIVEQLTRVGGHLYMVIHILGSTKICKKVIVWWSVNGAGVKEGIEIGKMARSASRALQQHRTFLSRRRPAFPLLDGMIVVSLLREKSELLYRNNDQKLPVLQINTDPRTWRSAINIFIATIESLLN